MSAGSSCLFVLHSGWSPNEVSNEFRWLEFKKFKKRFCFKFNEFHTVESTV